MSNSTRIRPRYKLFTDLSSDIVIKEIGTSLKKSNDITGRIVGSNVYLKIPKDENRYWSPELNVKVDDEEKGTSIKGLAGPNMQVWATFRLFYGLAIMLLIFGGGLGISQRRLDIDSIWILSVPISIALYVLIFLAAKYGQRLGNDQLNRLRNFLDDTIKNAENTNKSND